MSKEIPPLQGNEYINRLVNEIRPKIGDSWRNGVPPSPEALKKFGEDIKASRARIDAAYQRLLEDTEQK